MCNASQPTSGVYFFRLRVCVCLGDAVLKFSSCVLFEFHSKHFVRANAMRSRWCRRLDLLFFFSIRSSNLDKKLWTKNGWKMINFSPWAVFLTNSPFNANFWVAFSGRKNVKKSKIRKNWSDIGPDDDLFCGMVWLFTLSSRRYFIARCKILQEHIFAPKSLYFWWMRGAWARIVTLTSICKMVTCRSRPKWFRLICAQQCTRWHDVFVYTCVYLVFLQLLCRLLLLVDVYIFMHVSHLAPLS